MSNKSLSYRPDIDGLRALAVLAVVIFHINKGWLPGGFVGVDIFFVISGFLITGILKREQDKSIFSFANFYMRRIRRILPAALTTILITLIVGIFVLLPSDLKELGKSSLASVFSVANIYFWLFLDTGYFADSSETVPLLHMWSLGVEEQFYLIWPAIMLLTYKFGGRRLLIFVAAALAIVSFVIGEHFILTDQSFAYYMLPSRAGELLFGAILFLVIESVRRRPPRWAAECIGLIGLLLIVWSLVFLSEVEGFPGFRSVIPTLGAGLIIASGSFGGGVVTRLLSVRAAVAIGLVSFSLYLWHWPVMAFYRYLYGQHIDVSQFLACAAAIFALAIISYHLIEKPFRSSDKNRQLKNLYTPTSAVTVSVIAILLIINGGFMSANQENAFTAQEKKLRLFTSGAFAFKYNCQYNFFKDVRFDDDRCILGNANAVPDMIMIGDSHSAHYTGYMKEIASVRSAPIYNTSMSACAPTHRHSEKYVKASIAIECAKFNDAAFKEADKYHTVMISANWNVYEKNSPDFENDLNILMDELTTKGKRVIIGLNAPAFAGYDRMRDMKLIKIPSLGDKEKLNYPFKGYSKANEILLRLASKHTNVYIFDLTKMICQNKNCSPYLYGRPIYFDAGHISITGSEFLGRIAVRNKLFLPELMN